MIYETIETITQQINELTKEKKNQDEKITKINSQLEMKEKIIQEKKKVNKFFL